MILKGIILNYPFWYGTNVNKQCKCILNLEGDRAFSSALFGLESRFLLTQKVVAKGRKVQDHLKEIDLIFVQPRFFLFSSHWSFAIPQFLPLEGQRRSALGPDHRSHPNGSHGSWSTLKNEGFNP